MSEIFSKSKWIWNNLENNTDEYVEFIGEFSCNNNESIYLNLSFDTVCNVYVNDELVFFKKCADYPFYKYYDSVDVTKYCKTNNKIKFCVWYYGVNNASYFSDKAGLIFEVVQSQSVLLCSNTSILSRVDNHYKNGYKKNITIQLGFSFCYDNRLIDEHSYNKSVEVEKTTDFNLNKLKPLIMLDKSPSNVVYQKDNSILLDLEKEETGFLSLDIESDSEQKITVAYGEHIVDGGVRKEVFGRVFTVEIILKKGCNSYVNYFRRIAGRYLQIFYSSPIKLNYLGIIPVIYPTKEKNFVCINQLHQKIYDICVSTLKLCRHEHYEDCPWREQAMYVMDSRNQMLCGYFAFEGFDYARQQLVLMSKGITDNGLLTLTYPSNDLLSIPFFNLMYVVAVKEYIEYSNDKTILDEVLPTIDKIMETFGSFVDSNNLIANLPYPSWNFYEWAEGSHNDNEIMRTENEVYNKNYDLILNCGYLLAVNSYSSLRNTIKDVSNIKSAVRNNFFNEETGLFFLSLNKKELYTELGNSLAILCDVVTKEQSNYIVQQLKNSNAMVKVTLSMQCFKYDALLKNSLNNREFVLKDIEEIYGYMLGVGATSVWETILGEADFNGAGSLCHGWSAMPIYYFHKLLKNS